MSFLLVAQRALTVPGWVKNALWRAAKATPSLDLPFADSKSLVDAITGRQLISYARAGSGTYTDSAGVLQTAVTNLLLRSEEFNDASWTKTRSSATANAIAAPDGSLTADKITEDTTPASTHVIAQTGTLISIVGARYTYSVYAKADGRDWLIVSPGGVWGYAWFNVSTGALGTVVDGGGATTASITSVGNGWYRCVVSATAVDTRGLQLLLSNANNVVSYTGDGTSGIYLWGAQLEQSSTVGEYIPTGSTINSAPRFDHNPLTGESLGLLVEEQRTNSIRNNTMVGAIAGTPGTLPTNWISGASSGLAREIVGIGVENGIAYVDVRYFGTATSALFQYVAFEVATQVAATQSSIWTCSAFMKLVGGSLANINSVLLVIDNYNSSGTALAQYAVSGPLALTTSALITQRYSVSSTSSTFSNAATAFVRPYLQINANSGAVIDITLRIGLPQLEQGAFASSVIPTTTAAATRNADVAQITGTNFSSWYRQDEGTVYAEAQLTRQNATPGASVYGIQTTGTSAEAIQLFYRGGGSTGADINDGGVAQAGFSPYGSAVPANSITKQALGFRLNDANAAGGGVIGATDTSCTMPSPDLMFIGFSTAANNYLNGYIRRLAFWPQRLSNATLQSLSQP